MNALALGARRVAVVLLLTPLLCAADGLLRGELPAARPSTEASGVQVTVLPSGALMKRLPGQPLPGDATLARAAPLPAGVSVQQAGAAQMLVLANASPAGTTARPPGATVRQSGASLLLETPAQRAVAERAAAVAALPAGVRIVDLSPSEPLPLNPEPNTLYRRPN